jgi:hypothetical protein
LAPDFGELYQGFEDNMEDFWDRRANAPKFQRTIHVLGQAVIFHSNQEHVLGCAGIAERLYSSGPPNNEPAWNIHLIVHDPPGPLSQPPVRLVDLVHYAGADDWLSIGLDQWGHCYVDMPRAEAHAVLSSDLAARPEQVSQVLINTILTNLITRHGYSMLHASALVKDGRILLLQAPHGTGKSTTALRLLLNGYKLLSDSMVYIGERKSELYMGGFPVGRIKLREDMLPQFPELASLADTEPVRGEIKHKVDLDRVDPSLTIREVVRVAGVEYCLLERWSESHSKIEHLEEKELWPNIMLNSLHYDNPDLWKANLSRVGLLLKHARLHRLLIGTTESGILESVQKLWTQFD